VEQEVESQFDRGTASRWIELTESERDAATVGEIITRRVDTDEVDVPSGLIHDWLGVMFVPDVTAGEIVGMLRDVDSHAQYFTEVLDSRLISSDGDTVRSFLRLRKRKVLTVVLNTEYLTRYRELADSHWYVRSHSTKIAEVENAGSSNERELPVGEGAGFLWRLNVYWNLSETSAGTWVEIRTLSLSRKIPFLLAPVIRPFINSVPKESLEATLRGTREAVVK
jgi:hypothetical protein